MPIYEYECRACGEEHEIIQKVNDRPLRKCPACGALRLRRKVSLSAFHLKGQGWYATDYANGGGKNKEKEKKDAKGASAPASGKGESGAAAGGKAASGSASSPSSPAAKKDSKPSA